MAQFDYTSRDYLSIRQDLLSRASDLIPEWTSRSPSDFSVMLVDLWAYMGDILHYYIDRAAAETYLGTATKTESVLAIANLLDYRPFFQTSAEGTVTFYATDPNHSGTLTIPKNTGLYAPAFGDLPEVYYTTTQSASMGPSVTSVSVLVGEGKYVNEELPVNTITFAANSTGTPSQRFNLRNTGAVASSVAVYVYEGPLSGSPAAATAVEYAYTSDLATSDSQSKVYTIEVTSDGVMQIVFGNDVNGKVPNVGAKVTVSYRHGVGSLGNVDSGRITTFDSSNTVAGVYIGESSATTGGIDFESIDSIKENIPKMFRTQDRAVSKQDFKDLALRVPQVAKATCTVSGTNVMVHAIPYVVDYSAYTGASVTVDSLLQDGIVSYFEPRTLLGASVGAASAVALKPVNITVTVYVQPQYVAQWVKEEVISAIDDLFSFENVSFGQTLSIGTIYRTIQSIEGVDYVVFPSSDPPLNDGVFSFTSSGVSTTLTAGEAELLRKGTVTVYTEGGVTGILV